MAGGAQRIAPRKPNSRWQYARLGELPVDDTARSRRRSLQGKISWGIGFWARDPPNAIGEMAGGAHPAPIMF